MRAKIAGTGSYLPTQVLSNADLEKIVDTSDEWILQRVGISSRRIASSTETNVFMSTQAARKALAMANIDPAELDLIIVATSTPDHAMPSTAVEVQAALGSRKAFCFDMSAACGGFIYGLSVIKQFFATGEVKKALLIGAERMSRVVDWSDRSTCVLFGDGAGAAVFVVSEDSKQEGILSVKVHADGGEKDALYISNHLADQSRLEIEINSSSNSNSNSNLNPHLHMDGPRVFKAAVNMLGEVALEVLQDQNIAPEDIDWLVPHQANLRIILGTAKKLDLPEEKIVLTLGQQGNTSAASVPMALDIAVRDGRIQPGNLLLLEAFGSGYVWGAALVRY